jgi:hypothetical protein
MIQMEEAAGNSGRRRGLARSSTRQREMTENDEKEQKTARDGEE